MDQLAAEINLAAARVDLSMGIAQTPKGFFLPTGDSGRLVATDAVAIRCRGTFYSTLCVPWLVWHHTAHIEQRVRWHPYPIIPRRPSPCARTRWSVS